MKAHSAFGGSQASRYMRCPGSVALAETAPPPPESSYASEGTFAHALGEACLTGSKKSSAPYIGQLFAYEDHGEAKQGTVTKEMSEAVNVYLDAVWNEFDLDPDSEIETEQRFSLPIEAADDGEVFGTNDALVYSPKRCKLTIFDYKHGAGVTVDVEDNIQLKFYAMGALFGHPEWIVKEIELVIVQPRAFNAGEERGVKRWSLPMVETIEFPYELNEAIALAKSEGAPLHAGAHCRFCPASPVCPVREQEFIKTVREDMAGVSLPDFAEAVDQGDVIVTDYEHMGRVIEAYERLAPWIADLRSAIDSQLLAGVDIAGWKVVEAVSRRKWVSNEQEITSYLELMYGVPGELVTPRKLETISEVKRLLKSYVSKEQYAEAEKDLTLRFTVKESKGLVTAPASDKRAAIQPVAAEFGSVQLGSE